MRQVGIRVALQKTAASVQSGVRRHTALDHRETLGIGHRRVVVYRSDRNVERRRGNGTFISIRDGKRKTVWPVLAAVVCVAQLVGVDVSLRERVVGRQDPESRQV